MALNINKCINTCRTSSFRLLTFSFVLYEFLILTTGPSLAAIASDAELIAFGENVKELILKEDTEGLKPLMKYGISTPNDSFNREAAYKMIDDKTSWLYRRLFVGIGSAKAFFQRHKKTIIEISGSCDLQVISYTAEDGSEKFECDLKVFKYNGKIYIADFFTYPSF